MSHLGFSLFHISIKRTGATAARWTGSGLRNISGALSLRCCLSCPSSAELNPTPFQLLGPPEIPHSTVTVIPSKNLFFDENKFRLTPVGVEKNPCVQFYANCIYKKSLYDLLHSLGMSWYHCQHTTLKLICLLRNTNYFRNRRREEFFMAAMWLHQYHPKTLACNLKTFAKVGCLKDLLEILCRIVNSGTPMLQCHADITDRVELKRINLSLSRSIKVLRQRSYKTMISKRLIRKKQFMRRKILTRRKQNMKAVKDWTKTKKEKASYLRMEKRKMMVKKAFEKRMKAVKDKMSAKKEKATKRKEKRNMMAKKAIEWYNNDPKYRFLYDRISDLFAKLLKADLDHLNTGRTEKISMASKWCPSLYSSYDYSTLFCESVARRLFPYDSCPEYKGINESHYVYRVRNRLQKEVLVPLRKALELPEIYMSANQWNLLQYDRISSVALKTYKRAFYKHDRERFLQYLQNVQCPELPKTTANNILPHEILNLLQYVNGLEVAERQWKRMLDTYSKNGKFVNCISTFKMNDCTHGFCCGFTLMTSELCANPWKGKLLRYGDNPEIVSIEGNDLGSRINFCRLNNVVSPKGDDNDTEQWILRLLSFLDKILETAIDLNVSKQDMIKRVFVFDGTALSLREIWQYEGCCSSCVCGWSSSYEAMREKFKRNGYDMPETVHWDVSNYGSPVPALLSVEVGLTHISRPLETSFRGFLEGDGTLNLMAMMESEICSAGDPELLVLD